MSYMTLRFTKKAGNLNTRACSFKYIMQDMQRQESFFWRLATSPS